MDNHSSGRYYRRKKRKATKKARELYQNRSEEDKEKILKWLRTM